jgi:putative inorganic carbon (HCO3(-)) transporter
MHWTQAIRSPLDPPIALFLLLLPVSLWASFDVRTSLPKALGLLLGFAIFYGTRACISSPRRFTRVLLLYLCLGSAIAALALVGTKWLYKSPILSRMHESLPQWIRGLPGAAEGLHPNEVAGVLLWFVPLQTALLVWCLKSRSSSTGARAALLLSTMLTSVTLVLTESRGGLLGLTAGGVVMVMQVRPWARKALILLLIIVLAMTAIRGPSWIAATLAEGIAPDVIGRSNWKFRLVIWRAAVRGISDFPFTGMGLGAFRHVARVLYPLANVPMEFDYAHAHNGSLQAALDFGIVGLFAYAGLWLITAKTILWSLRQSEGWLRAVTLGFWGCLASSFIYNLTDTVALGARGGLAWWMMLGLIVAIPRVIYDSHVAPNSRS